MSFQDVSPPSQGAGISLILRLGEVRYRAFGAPGSEIAPCPEPVTVPGCPGWLRGLVLHKGEARPLVDLGMALDDSATPARGGAARMLVTVSGGCRLAWRVDDVEADDGRDGAADLDLDALSRDLLHRAADWRVAEEQAA